MFSTDAAYILYDDVIPFFTWLRRWNRDHAEAAIMAGVITNSDNRVPQILRSLGIRVRCCRTSGQHSPSSPAEDLGFVVLSYDVEQGKPARHIFDVAVQRAGFADRFRENSSRLFVGDEPEADYQGATKAGWQALLLDRSLDLHDTAGYRQEPSKSQGFDRLSTLDELPAVLMRLLH